MKNSSKKIIVIGAATALVIFGIVYLPSSDSYMGLFVKSFFPPNWEDVSERDIVKNSIPITILDRAGDTCHLSAENLDKILSHRYFVRSDDLARELNYDKDSESISLPCGILSGDKSRLEIWYATDESPKHAKNFQYFVKPWNSTGL